MRMFGKYARIVYYKKGHDDDTLSLGTRACNCFSCKCNTCILRITIHVSIGLITVSFPMVTKYWLPMYLDFN